VGGTLRKLRDDDHDAVPSPSGSRIAFFDRNEIWVMGRNGEDANRLLAAEKGYSLERVEWSPDGQRLAYLKSHRGYDEVLIESRDWKGGRATVIMSDSRLRNFCWAPDWRIIYVRLEDPMEASANIWEISTDPSTTRSSGDPRRLTNWAGFSLSDLSVTTDGKRIAFVRKNDQSDIYLADLEGNGSRLNEPRRLTLDDRMDWLGGWSRDSKAVLFFSDRNGNFDIFRQAINDRTAEEIVVGPEEKRTPQLSPDGNWILYLAWPRTNSTLPPERGGLMRVPATGGTPEIVLEVKGYPGSAQAPRERWLPTTRGYPDFRCPFLASRPCILSEANQEQIVFFAFDSLQGRKGELAKIEVDPRDTFWDLSPDGSRIAFGRFEEDGGHIRILDLPGGKAREIALKGWAGLDSVAWSADGRSLFVTNWASKGGSILRLGLNGETQLLHKALGMALERPLPSPDGRYLACSQVATTSNAWMIENH